ncbi:Nudix family hydrolase [Methylococcus geothermalis]|uniref:8-oxo-dGTP diphosphatase n=1 Tax=Methylococcus geothermalis TaxID=2681310 RepID=A0A858Q8Z2_9GAMM|nr:Nudix family hydrolase [Methylococcus geothermalis]QJD30176.1 Nudix family hydrolase [Methylococcus geothermalis]
MSAVPKKEIRVAAGVIEDAAGRILIAQRSAEADQGGLWEFPGGKIEPGETPFDALRRELMEEIGIAVDGAEPMLVVRHAYPRQRVILEIFRVRKFSGEARGCLGQPIRWVGADDLVDFRFPAANRFIVAAARLPFHYPIVDDVAGDLSAMRRHFRRLVAGGFSLIQLRAKTLERAVYRSFAQECIDCCAGSNVRLILNAEPELAVELGAAGVHLTSARLNSLSSRPLDNKFWVAASCHDAGELEKAESLRLDFAVFGPVLPTRSHPASAPLGWERFSECLQAVNLPVYALGGLAAEHLVRARSAGAWGIAGIRGFSGS